MAETPRRMGIIDFLVVFSFKNFANGVGWHFTSELGGVLIGLHIVFC